MIADALRKSILQQAIQGKLSKQLPTDGDARALLREIQAEKLRLIAEKKIKAAPPLPPITADEIPFEIPQNWCWARLGDIGFTNIGLTYSPQNISNDGVIVLRSGNIQNGKINYTDIVKVAMNIPENKLCKEGDILICARNGSKKLVGKAAIIDKDGVTFGAFMAVFRSKINPYILAVINSPHFRKMLAGDVGTMTINQITQDMLKNFLVPLPPLAEQKRIVAKLEKLMPLLERLDAAEKKLAALNKAFPDQLRKSILQQAIQGKLSKQLPTDGDARALLREIQAEKLRLIAEKKIKAAPPLPPITADEIPFEIPQNWCWVRLGDICKYIQRGKSPKYSTEKKYPVISQKCNQLSGFSIEQAKFIEPDSLKSYDEEKILKNEDLLWNSTGLGTVGRMAIYDSSKNPYELAVADSHVTVVRPFKNILHKFIFFFVISPAVQSKMDSIITGSTKQKELETSTVKNLLIPLPPLAEQKRIVAKLEKVLPLCDRLAEKLK